MYFGLWSPSNLINLADPGQTLTGCCWRTVFSVWTRCYRKELISERNMSTQICFFFLIYRLSPVILSWAILLLAWLHIHFMATGTLTTQARLQSVTDSTLPRKSRTSILCSLWNSSREKVSIQCDVIYLLFITLIPGDSAQCCSTWYHTHHVIPPSAGASVEVLHIKWSARSHSFDYFF